MTMRTFGFISLLFLIVNPSSLHSSERAQHQELKNFLDCQLKGKQDCQLKKPKRKQVESEGEDSKQESAAPKEKSRTKSQDFIYRTGQKTNTKGKSSPR